MRHIFLICLLVDTGGCSYLVSLVINAAENTDTSGTVSVLGLISFLTYWKLLSHGNCVVAFWGTFRLSLMAVLDCILGFCSLCSCEYRRLSPCILTQVLSIRTSAPYPVILLPCLMFSNKLQLFNTSSVDEYLETPFFWPAFQKENEMYP